MTAVRIIAYIGAGLFIIFGALFILAAFGEVFNSGWLFTGFILVLIGFGLIWLGTRSKPTATAAGQDVTLKIDLPADVQMDTLRCENCGGPLKPENIKMVAGAPVVTCPYCGTTYQLKEEPKW